jgi:DNA segregation ATPase FtsK/SpoIIIE-like protein
LTVIGRSGAEKLPENNEMLFLTPGLDMPEHLDGYCLSDEEVEAVARAARPQGTGGDL